MIMGELATQYQISVEERIAHAEASNVRVSVTGSIDRKVKCDAG